jgi:hypothetical protein
MQFIHIGKTKAIRQSKYTAPLRSATVQYASLTSPSLRQLSECRPAQGLPCSMQDYLELVDLAARIVRSDKKHAMPNSTPPILTRLGFTPEQFEKNIQSKAMSHGSAIGQINRPKAYARHLDKRCVMGVSLKVPVLKLT